MKLTLPPLGNIIHKSPKIPQRSMLYCAHDIIGRGRMIHKVYQKLHEYAFEKCIVVVGHSKIGKTEVSPHHHVPSISSFEQFISLSKKYYRKKSLSFFFNYML